MREGSIALYFFVFHFNVCILLNAAANYDAFFELRPIFKH